MSRQFPLASEILVYVYSATNISLRGVVMAKKRKVANLMALAVLATVVQRNAPLRGDFTGGPRQAATWTSSGSLYTVVAISKRTDCSRPSRSPGRALVPSARCTRSPTPDATNSSVGPASSSPNPRPNTPGSSPGCLFWSVLTPRDVIDLLRRRLGRLTKTIDALTAQLRQASDVPRLFLIEDEYRIAMTQAETDWTRSLLDDCMPAASFTSPHGASSMKPAKCHPNSLSQK